MGQQNYVEIVVFIGLGVLLAEILSWVIHQTVLRANFSNMWYNKGVREVQNERNDRDTSR